MIETICFACRNNYYSSTQKIRKVSQKRKIKHISALMTPRTCWKIQVKLIIDTASIIMGQCLRYCSGRNVDFYSARSSSRNDSNHSTSVINARQFKISGPRYGSRYTGYSKCSTFCHKVKYAKIGILEYHIKPKKISVNGRFEILHNLLLAVKLK